MADWRGMMSKSSGFGGGSMRNNEDFEEEDVWGVVNNERGNSSPKMMRKSNKDNSSAASSSVWRLPTAPRIIPRAAAASTPTSHESKVVQKSAPQNIPDWSKIYGKDAKIGSWVNDDGYGVNGGHVASDDGGHVHGVSDAHDVNDDGDSDDDDDDGMVPPHEWVARKLARSQISSFSVCEGIGRTLKGRDLSKVRNAILTKTGFLE